MKCKAEHNVIEGLVRERYRRAVKTAEGDRSRAKVFDVEACRHRPVDLLDVLAEVPASAPDVQNAVTVTDIIGKHFGLAAVPRTERLG